MSSSLKAQFNLARDKISGAESFIAPRAGRIHNNGFSIYPGELGFNLIQFLLAQMNLKEYQQY